MTTDNHNLGRRIRDAREACAMTQDDVARHLKLSRSTLAQIELGNRIVKGLELSHLAYLFGRDVRHFLEDDTPKNTGGLVALFRLHPEIANQQDIAEALRASIALGRELTGLDQILGIHRDLGAAAIYPLPQPKTKWDAVQQGERVAEEERRRLGLGMGPLPDLAELLETQGINTAQSPLPADISGLTLIGKDIGFFVIANREHPLLRRRFSWAHEYCHILVDRDQQGMVSRAQDRDELREVRANSFAATFLIPDESLKRFVHNLGKGRPSRIDTQVFDEDVSIPIRARSAPKSQDIQFYDVVQIAHYFRVSRASAIYRLRSLGFINKAELSKFLAQSKQGYSRKLSRVMERPEPYRASTQNEVSHRFIGLAFEAYRREEITHSRLVELAAMIHLQADEVDQTLRDLGLDHSEGAGVRLPGE